MPMTRLLHALLCVPLFALCVGAAQAQQHAHVHGQLKLDVAIDAQTLTVAIDAPLDGFVGFERAPRTDAERKTAQQAVAQLQAADKLFVIDPAAGCKLAQIELDAPTLGLGQARAGEPEGHADLEASFTFQCRSPAQARFIDLTLFEAFRHLQQIDAQIAAPDGQYQRTLRRPARRLAWGR